MKNFLQIDGHAVVGPQTAQNGLLSWPEVCAKLPNPIKCKQKGPDGPLRKVDNPTKWYESFAYRLSDDNGELVLFEETAIAAVKAELVKAKGLGGVGIFSLNFLAFLRKVTPNIEHREKRFTSLTCSRIIWRSWSYSTSKGMW